MPLTQDDAAFFARLDNPATPEKQSPSKGSYSDVRLDDLLKSEGAEHLKPMVAAIYGQESSGGRNPATSVDGARGGMQVMPATFKRFAKDGEAIDNPEHNLRAGIRYIKFLGDRFGNDPARIAAGYFSGEGNVAKDGETPFVADRADGNGTKVSQYVAGILKRLGDAAIPIAQASEGKVPAKPGGAVKWPSIFDEEGGKAAGGNAVKWPSIFNEAEPAPAPEAKPEEPAASPLLDRLKKAVGWREGEQFKRPEGVTDDTFSAGVPDIQKAPTSVMEGYRTDTEAPSKNIVGMTAAGEAKLRGQLQGAPDDRLARYADQGGLVGQVAARVLEERGAYRGKIQAGKVPTLTEDMQAGVNPKRWNQDRYQDDNREYLRRNKGAVMDYLTKAQRLTLEDAELAYKGMLDKGVVPNRAGMENTRQEAGYGDVLAVGAKRAHAALGRGYMGLGEWLGDAFGVDALSKFSAAAASGYEADFKEAADEVVGKIPQKGFKALVAETAPSIISQLPGVLGAGLAMAATRNPAVMESLLSTALLTPMGVQVFGETYRDGKAAGLSLTDNTIYSAGKAMAEVLPERLSLGALFRVMGGATKGTARQLAVAILGQQATEHATEQITTVAQFLLDKAYTQPDLSIKDLQQQMVDTFKATALQAPILAAAGAGAAVTGRGASALRDKMDPTGAMARQMNSDVESGQFDPAQIDREARRGMDPNAAESDVVAPEAVDFVRQPGVAPVANAPGTEQVPNAPAPEAEEAPSNDSMSDELLALEGGHSAAEDSSAPAAEATGPTEIQIGGKPLSSLADHALSFLIAAHPNQAIKAGAAAELERRNAAVPATFEVESDGVKSAVSHELKGRVDDATIALIQRSVRGPLTFEAPSRLRNITHLGQPGSSVSSEDLAKLISGISGRGLVLFRGENAPDGIVADRQNVFLNEKQSVSPTATAFHELWHVIEDEAPDIAGLWDAAVKANAKTDEGALLDFLARYEPAHFKPELIAARLGDETPAEVLDDLLETNNAAAWFQRSGRGDRRAWALQELKADLLGEAANRDGVLHKALEHMATVDIDAVKKLAQLIKGVLARIEKSFGKDFGTTRNFVAGSPEEVVHKIRALNQAAAEVLGRFANRQASRKRLTGRTVAELSVIVKSHPDSVIRQMAQAELEGRQRTTDNAETQGASHARNNQQAESAPGSEATEVRRSLGRDEPQDSDATRRGDVQDHGAGARQDSGAGQTQEVARYGSPHPGATTVQGIHYSGQQRDSLNSAYYGTGIAGAEARRLTELPEAFRNRTYFYVDEGQGVFPEAGVGIHAHTVALENLYDAVADSQGLARANPGDHNGFEMAVVAAGYDGYYIPAGFDRQGVAVVIGRHQIPVTYLGTEYRGGDPNAIKKPPKPQEKSPILTDRRLPMGQMTAAEWKRTLDFLLSAEAAKIDWSRLDPEQAYYPEQLVREGMGAQFSPSRLGSGDATIKSALEADKVRLFGFNVRGGVIVGAPGFVHTLADIKRQIHQAMHDARSDQSHPEDAVWYQQAGRAIREYSHGDERLMERLTRLVAKLSQGAGVDSNVTSVIKAAYQMAQGETPAVGRFPNAFRELFAPLMEAETFDAGLKGVDRKLQNFYRNLRDEAFQENQWPDAVVIDRHAIGYIWQDKAKQTVDSDAQYDYAERIIQKATTLYNKENGDQLRPRDLQALLWGWWKRRDAAEAAKADGREFKAEGTAWNYPEFFERATANVTAEVLPSTARSHLDQVLSPEEKAQFQKEALDLIFDKDGQNELARRAGLVLYSERESTGGYEDKINPNLVIGAIASKTPKESGSGDPYHRYTYDAVDRYALGWQYIYQQDGVPWFRADRTVDPADLDKVRASRAKRRAEGKKVAEKAEPPMMAKGFFITFDAELSPEKERAMFDALRMDVDDKVGYTKLKSNAVAVINYRDEAGVPFLMSDADFNSALDQFRRMDGVAAIEPFAAESRYHYHDFHEDPQASGILSADPIQSGQRDLQDWLRGRREAFDALVQRWEEAHPRNAEQEVRRSLARREVPEESQTDHPFDGTELASLRRLAASIERPRDGVFFRVTDDGRAIATGPKGTRVPEAFRRFAEDHGLVLETRRNGEAPPRPGNSHVTSKSEPMPGEYRESGALYFGENNTWFDRTGLTRFSPSRVQTESPEFKAWSKGLPVYDDAAKAASDRGVFRLYHATTADFSEFIPGGLNKADSGEAIWLSPYKEYQAAYFRTGSSKRFNTGTNVMPLYARLERPLVIDDKTMLGWAKDVYGEGSDQFPQIMSSKTVAAIKADGYDSIVFHGEKLGWGKNSDEYMVFDPTQVKSAIGNNGQFDAGNPDIRFSPDRTQTYSLQRFRAIADAFEKRADEALSSPRYTKPVLIHDNTPASMQILGWADRKLMIEPSDLHKIANKPGFETNAKIGSLVNDLGRPGAMFWNEKQGSLNILRREDMHGAPALIAVRPDVNVRGLAHLMVTAHRLENQESLVRKITSGELKPLYLDQANPMVKSAMQKKKYQVSAGGLAPENRHARDSVLLGTTSRLLGPDDLVKWEQETWGENPRFSPQRLAPNGQPSKLSDEQWHLVRTPEFKAWFGDWEQPGNAGEVSTVVDRETGEPLVVFHGAFRGGFTAFRDDRPIFTASTRETAASYAGTYEEVDLNAPHPGSGILPLFVNLRNPLKANFGGQRYFLMDKVDGMDATDAMADLARRSGHDGAIIEDVIDDGGNFREEIDNPADLYVVFNAAQVKSAVQNTGLFDPGIRDLRFSQGRATAEGTWSSPESTRLDKVIYELQDKHIDLKRIREAIQANGRDVKERFDPYLAEETYHGRAAWKAQHFLENEVQPLMTLLKASSISMADFERYLHARHAKERNARMAEINPDMPDNEALSGMSDEEAEKILADVAGAPKARAYGDLAARLDHIVEGTRNLLVASGLESPEMIAKWKGAYEHYVPLFRDLGEVDELNAHMPGSGFSVRGSASKYATGSNKPVEHILSHVVMQREQAITRAEKNAVAMALYGMVLEHPNARFWGVVHPNKGRAELETEMRQLGFSPDVIEALVAAPKLRTVDPSTGLVVERLNPLYKSEPTTLVLRLKGEDRVILFSKKDERAVRLVTSLKNMDVDSLHGALGVASRITRYFAAINTQYNPVFGLTNFARDIQGAILNLSSTPIAGAQAKIAADALPAIRGIWLQERGRAGANTWAKLYQEFTEEGGATGYRDAFASASDRATALEKMISPSWYQRVPALEALLDVLADYNTAIENGIRLATYKVARDQGLSKQMAASIAKNITVNFNRKGRSGREINSLFAFFNAAVQGTARMAETLKGPAGRKVIAGGLLLGAVQALIGLAAFGDEWDDIPEFERQRNLIIPTFGAGKRYFKVPLPLGFHVLPNLARMATEMAHFRNNYGERVGNLLAMLTETFNPLGGSSSLAEQITPTMFDPIVQLAANRDFTGREIAKLDRSGLAPTPGHSRAKEQASTLAKMASKGINAATGGTEYSPGTWSPTPDQIDFLFGQLTGGVGRELNKAQKAVEMRLSGQEPAPHQIPVAGRFYGALDGEAAVKARYFENVREVSRHKLEIEGRAKDGKAFQEYSREHPDFRLAWVAEGTQRGISELERYRRRLENSAADSAATEQQKKEIDKKILELMQWFNVQVKTTQKERQQ